MFNKLCIIGVGLIGGSIARAAKYYELSHKVVGFGRGQDLVNLQEALKLGVIDQYYLNLSEACAEADCVIIATPVSAVESVLSEIKPFWNEHCVYSDVGSTKLNVFSAAQKAFGFIPQNLVPGHPIAGAEQSGVSASNPSLFTNKRIIITPDSATNPVAIQRISDFWRGLGANVELMTAEHHDAVLAATSHLPHIAAFALVDMLGQRDEQSEIFKYAASGFRDFTRIASSDPTMWLDICTENKTEIIPLLKELQSELHKIQHMLENDEKQQLFNTFNYARKARQRFLDLFEN